MGGAMANEDHGINLEKQDYRIGVWVKPKYRTHPFFGKTGEIFDVLPSGFNGIQDKDGVLKVLMDGSGAVVVCGADEMITADCFYIDLDDESLELPE